MIQTTGTRVEALGEEPVDRGSTELQELLAWAEVELIGTADVVPTAASAATGAGSELLRKLASARVRAEGHSSPAAVLASPDVGYTDLPAEGDAEEIADGTQVTCLQALDHIDGPGAVGGVDFGGPLQSVYNGGAGITCPLGPSSLPHLRGNQTDEHGGDASTCAGMSKEFVGNKAVGPCGGSGFGASLPGSHPDSLFAPYSYGSAATVFGGAGLDGSLQSIYDGGAGIACPMGPSSFPHLHGNQASKPDKLCSEARASSGKPKAFGGDGAQDSFEGWFLCVGLLIYWSAAAAHRCPYYEC